ncbi:hypothetical protein EK904_012818 [Melospiza melodia maxima]|nr:hypothetical protein EK904_012818 [Melospiza melodia maxima]
MKQDSTRNTSYTVDCEDYVHVVKFNPFDSGDSCSLIAYGGNNYVVVGSCRFQEEDAEVEGMQYKTLRTFHHGIRVDAIAWSPETRLDAIPPQIRYLTINYSESLSLTSFILSVECRFCTAASDRKLRLFTSDLQDKNEFKTFDGHTDYINDLVFAPNEGQEIASVSDDHTCRVWDLEGNEKAHFVLRSSGMSVCWHPEEAFKLMVAEKNGTIRFYDLITQQAILSLEFIHRIRGLSMLTEPDYSGVFGKNIHFIHGWIHFTHRWSRVNENLFATTGYPGKTTTQLLVHHLGHPQPILTGTAAVGSGLTWHRTLPLCAVGGDHKIFFWVTEM